MTMAAIGTLVTIGHGSALKPQSKRCPPEGPKYFTRIPTAGTLAGKSAAHRLD